MFSYNLVVPDRDVSPVPPRGRAAQEEPRLLYDSDTELNLDLVGVHLMTRQAVDV